VRKTISVLIDYIDHLSRGYEFELRRAFDAACAERDVNLMILAGRALEDPDPWNAAHNAVYELVEAGAVHGVVMASASLAQFTGVEGVQRLAQRYAGTPLCSLGLQLPGIPSVVLDARSGMETLVEHMVCDHACRRIVFLGGPARNPDAEERLAAFNAVLERHGIERDPRLVLSTDFTFSAGKRAIEELLRRGASFDAVIAANDGLGIGATEALRAHNLRVPLNVRVSGFDDLAVSRLGDPPLSTVRQPLAEMAELAVDCVLAQVDGQDVADVVWLPTQFVGRESCGCGSYGMRTASLPPLQLSRRSAEFIQNNLPRLTRLLSFVQRGNTEVRAARCRRLLLALEAELNGERLAFISEIEALLAGGADDSESFEEFQRVITLLREELRVLNDPQLEELWHESRTQVSVLNTRSQMRQRMHLEDMYDRLLITGERFSTNLEIGSLKRALLEELPAAHVYNAALALYASSDRRELEAFLCLRDGNEFRPPPGAFPTCQLFPSGALDPGRRYTWIGLALTFETELLGVMLFEYSPSIVAYQMFRDRVSLALKTADLHREIVRQTAAQERSTQEKLATAERIQSLSVLAGGVAHDLNNALGPLAALPDMILEELAKAPGAQPQTEIIDDLLAIKAAALRAAQTIKDLLTLGRQRQVSKETLDLNHVALNSAMTLSRDVLNRNGHEVQLMMRVSPTPLYVNASEAHLIRAVTNLVLNGAEALTRKGSILVRTDGVRLNAPRSGYELIEPGDYAVVSVRDSGQGIPEESLRRIFEPFFSAKKLSGSGSGSGSGLGLAIVHGVVKEHAGFIDVRSTPGVGTEFALYFPRVTKVAPAVPAPKFEPRPGHGKVLVLDDEPMQLRTARRILTRAGYDVVTTQNPSHAWELVSQCAPPGEENSESTPFDLVILDMILHESEDGLDVFDRIRSRFPEQKGILVSGHTPMERGALALERGMTWLSKPYTAEALISAVQSALQA